MNNDEMQDSEILARLEKAEARAAKVCTYVCMCTLHIHIPIREVSSFQRVLYTCMYRLQWGWDLKISRKGVLISGGPD